SHREWHRLRRGRMNPFLVALALTSTAVAPSPATYSAFGPGQGQTVLGLGGKVFVLTANDTAYPLPAFALDLAYGLEPDVDYQLHLSTVGVLTLLETGLRARILTGAHWGLAANGALAGALGFGKNAQNDFTVTAFAGL